MKKISAFILIALTVLLIGCNNKKSEGTTVETNETKTASTDSIVQTDSISNAVTGTEKSQSLADVYKQLEKAPQVFSILTSKDTTLICAEGTRIKIKANSFINEKTKQPVTGNVKISITEYYKISDILLAQLSTVTNGKMLETGGMLNITASSNNGNCILKKDAAISIEFPGKPKKEGMELYNGNWKNESSINWTLDKNAVDLNKIYSEVDVKPIYPGGTEKMYQFISRNIDIVDGCDKGGKVHIGFVIDKTGKVTNARIIRGFNNDCDNAVLKSINKLSNFIPGKINGEPVNVSYMLPVTITPSEEKSDYDQLSPNKNLSEKYNKNTVQNANTAEVASYLFKSSKLGWINCDRIWQVPTQDYIVDLNTGTQTSVNIIFHKYKSVLNGSFNTASYIFYKAPANEKVTIVAIKYIDGIVQLAIKETETGNKKLEDLAFKPVTFPILREELKKLNRFN
jgi:hypothetical protein